MNSKQATRTDVFLTHDHVASSDSHVTPVDVRSPDEYGSKHIPGAINIPFDQFRTETDADLGKLPGAETFSSLLGDCGIDPETPLVAYDDSFGVYAARFLVTARIYGHDAVRVAEGDFTAWKAAYPTGETSPVRESGAYPARRIDDPPILDSHDFADVVESDAIVVDTRVKYEYRVAHVPDAVQLNWRSLVDTETRKPQSEPVLEEILENHGIVPDERVALYCNTARRLSFVYAVLKSLGYDDVVFFEGGLPDWTDAGFPVETGS